MEAKALHEPDSPFTKFQPVQFVIVIRDLSARFVARVAMRRIYFFIFGSTFIQLATGAFVSSCQAFAFSLEIVKYEPCRWSVTRKEEDSSTVIVNDESTLNINWNWDVRGGHWNVTYLYRYPSEWYSGKAVFVNCSIVSTAPNAYVTWGSSEPWTSNAIPVYANAWNITYNGDIFGFVPTQNGRYMFRIYTKNKSHNPFGDSEQIVLPGGECTFSSNNATLNSAWWKAQKARNTCAEPALVWNWSGRNGKWTVLYRYFTRTKMTTSDVFYQRTSLQPIKAITWVLDETKQTVSYAANPIRIYESAWKHTLSPSESWGFVPKNDGLWNYQIFSRNLVFEPFKNLRIQSPTNVAS